MDFQDDYKRLADRLSANGINVDAVKQKLKDQKIETPSWGYGNSGTRFKVFAWPGAARNVHEKLEDAAYIHQLTGIAPSVALHIPWDKVDDWSALSQFAQDKGVEIGAINPNVFRTTSINWVVCAIHLRQYAKKPSLIWSNVPRLCVRRAASC